MASLGDLARRLFGTSSTRKIKAYEDRVARINALEPELAALEDSGLRARTAMFRERLAGGERMDDLLVPAFATVREAARRTLGQRHFDVQLIGGMVLHEGRIAEMKTGEGKTLAATLPVYLNALAGRGVHVVTVNDYLARRDSEWMGRIYEFLGLSAGCILHGMNDEERRAAYAADVIYGTNNELGFDYLRDNMKYRLEAMVQRGHCYAIVDEVDSILIDEARTPLIISGAMEGKSELYAALDALAPRLRAGDYELDEKLRTVTLTEEGNEHMEELLREAGLLEDETLYDIGNVTIVHHVNQALRAHTLFQKDRDYIVKNGRVVIIDEFTGRMMEGRRYADGLHQALEAKEKADIQPENQTLASITFQNYFRLYDKLAGMTGTAVTEAEEFMDIYGLDVVEAPTNLPVARDDLDDEVYRTEREKYDAIIDLIADCHRRGQPVLVGTVSIEKSERLSALLKTRKVDHNVLNARYHEQEAHIVAQAGVPGTVTIATNMAGRGTDIQLGGNADMRIETELAGVEDEAERAAGIARIRADVEARRERVIAEGGVFVLGTERHESRRIDNQLRGRAGRQGDPGGSKFFLSLEDDLMRIFGTGRIDGMLQKLGLRDGEAIVHPWINKAIEKAQKKVEARNFDTRKNLLKFDDVMNDQRKAIFEQRIEFMRSPDVNDTVTDMRRQLVDDIVAQRIPERAYAEQWDWTSLGKDARDYFGLDLPVRDWAGEEGLDAAEIRTRLNAAPDRVMAAKAAGMGPDLMRQVERAVLLQTIDHHWREHLLTLEHLRQVVGLRGYGQRDPLNEYKTESFMLFETMLSSLRGDVTRQLMRVQVSAPAPELEEAAPRNIEAHHVNPLTGRDDVAEAAMAFRALNATGAEGATGGRGVGTFPPLGTNLRGADSPPQAAPPPGPQAHMPPQASSQAQSAPGDAPAPGPAPGPAPVRTRMLERDPSNPATWGKVPRNLPCPCGSGKKYKHCHGGIA